MKICLCVGTRPNFIKAAPLIRAFKKYNVPYRLVYTGQHYDYNMAGVFFEELGISKPDVTLSILKNISSVGQITHTMKSFHSYCRICPPDIIVVFGDVNSMLACAMVAESMRIKLAHIEAGERCFDNAMVEERNRKRIDSISDYLFCASEASLDNLIDEKISNKAYLVGNTMIDQLKHIQLFLKSTKADKPYAVFTLHRAENVDNLERLRKIYNLVLKVAEQIKIIFPCHPRAKKQINKLGQLPLHDNLVFEEPLSYFAFMKLVNNAKFVMTDSGGLQMETSYLNIPCITLRESTEWVETLEHGTNWLWKPTYDISHAVDVILQGGCRQSKIKDMPLHDGKAAERIMEILKKL